MTDTPRPEAPPIEWLAPGTDGSQVRCGKCGCHATAKVAGVLTCYEHLPHDALRPVAGEGEMQSIDSAPKDGTPVLVVTSYRYLPYKPEGRRQMKSPGRWLRATEYGWENAPAPEQWLTDAPKPPQSHCSREQSPAYPSGREQDGVEESPSANADSKRPADSGNAAYAAKETASAGLTVRRDDAPKPPLSPSLALAHGGLIADLRTAHEYWTLHGYPEGSGTLFKLAADALEGAPSLALAEENRVLREALDQLIMAFPPPHRRGTP